MNKTIRKYSLALALIFLCHFGMEIQAQNLKQLPKPILIRPFGDSITYGLGFSDWGLCYFAQINQSLCMPPSQLGGGYRGFMTLLATQGIGIYFTTEGYQSGGSYFLQWQLNTQTHDGYPGYRTDQLINFSNYASFSDYTLIHAGTNDIVQGKSIETASLNLFTIINNLLQMNSRTTLIVAQIIQISSTNQKYSPLNLQIVAYNNLIQSKWNALPANLQARVKIVNMNGVLNDLQDYSPDGVHPNANGYLKMACKWIGAINASPPAGACSGLNLESIKRKMNPSNLDENLLLPPKDKVERLLKGEI